MLLPPWPRWTLRLPLAQSSRCVRELGDGRAVAAAEDSTGQDGDKQETAAAGAHPEAAGNRHHGTSSARDADQYCDF